MIVEMRLGRGWRVYIDGKLPDTDWEVGEPLWVGDPENDAYNATHPAAEYVFNTAKLTFNGRRVESIGFDGNPEGEYWFVDRDGTRLGPCYIWIKWEDEPIARMLAVKLQWYARGDDPVVYFKLFNGDYLEVDETHMFIHAEDEEGA